MASEGTHTVFPCFVSGGGCGYEQHHMLSDGIENCIQDQFILAIPINIVQRRSCSHFFGWTWKIIIEVPKMIIPNKESLELGML